eukprot:Awhi_evm1s8051
MMWMLWSHNCKSTNKIDCDDNNNSNNNHHHHHNDESVETIGSKHSLNIDIGSEFSKRGRIESPDTKAESQDS